MVVLSPPTPLRDFSLSLRFSQSLVDREATTHTDEATPNMPDARAEDARDAREGMRDARCHSFSSVIAFVVAEGRREFFSHALAAAGMHSRSRCAAMISSPEKTANPRTPVKLPPRW